MPSAIECTGLSLEELKALYGNKTGNRYGDFIDPAKQYTVRQWDGMDGCWTDCLTGSAEQALVEWWARTEAGSKRTSFDDIDYYRIFPADGTKMLFSGRNEMFRQPEHPDPEIAAEVQADAELAEKVDALVARVSELEAENKKLRDRAEVGMSNETMETRSEVTAFAQAMEKRLAEFDEAKGADSWKSAISVEFFLRRLYEKLQGLDTLARTYEKMSNSKQPQRDLQEVREGIRQRAADIANYCMMVLDLCGALPLAQPTPVEVASIHMRGSLKNARAQLTALGTPDDAVNNAVLEEIDETLKSAPFVPNPVLVLLRGMKEEERDTILRGLGYVQGEKKP